jgi:hypothetical protein
MTSSLDVVIEFEGQEVPVLAQVDLTSIRTLRLSLAKALYLTRPVDTQLLYWERGRGYVFGSFLSNVNARMSTFLAMFLRNSCESE